SREWARNSYKLFDFCIITNYGSEIYYINCLTLLIIHVSTATGRVKMPAPVPNVAYADFKLPPVIKSRDLRKRCQRRADFAVDKVVELVSKWSSSLVLLILQLQALLISLFS